MDSNAELDSAHLQGDKLKEYYNRRADEHAAQKKKDDEKKKE